MREAGEEEEEEEEEGFQLENNRTIIKLTCYMFHTEHGAFVIARLLDKSII